MYLAKKEEGDTEPGLSQMSALTALPSTQASMSQTSVRAPQASGSRRSRVQPTRHANYSGAPVYWLRVTAAYAVTRMSPNCTVYLTHIHAAARRRRLRSEDTSSSLSPTPLPQVSSESESERREKSSSLPGSSEKGEESDAAGEDDPDAAGEGEEGREVRSSVQSLTVSGNSLFAAGVEDSSFQIEDEIAMDEDAPAVQPVARGVAQQAEQPVAQAPPQPVAQNLPQPEVKITPQPVAENTPSQVEDVESEFFI